MGILDELNKTVAGGVGRMRFEARKLQTTSRIQGEIYDLRHQFDTSLRKLGEQTLRLYQQGQITTPGIAELATTLQGLQAQLAAKEQELQQAQADVYVEPPAPPETQRVPIDTQPDMPVATPGQHTCPRCGYISSPTALFCSNCGTRVAP